MHFVCMMKQRRELLSSLYMAPELQIRSSTSNPFGDVGFEALPVNQTIPLGQPRVSNNPFGDTGFRCSVEFLGSICVYWPMQLTGLRRLPDMSKLCRLFHVHSTG
ncbi:hypothetical protein V6N11_007513 [Hibiscus sabdariffa]|uniref:Uncharacterized protein n=2 Tax=Hibiscus sabdariffa TaxID=183260 RepID=A0ABR2NSA7_9ROSI